MSFKFIVEDREESLFDQCVNQCIEEDSESNTGNKRSKEETIEYFKKLSRHFERDYIRGKSMEDKGKSEAYQLAAFELGRNTI